MYQGMTVRLYPTKAQEKQFRNQIGGCRFMWNYMLKLQMERHERNEKYFKKFDMFKHITEMKKKPEYKWLSEIAVHSLQRVCADLDWAYQKVFRHTSGRPKFKSKKKAKQSYPVPAEHMYFRYGYAQVSMVGKVRYKADYPGIDVESLKVYNPRIMYVNEKWLLVFAADVGDKPLQHKKGRIGIDLGMRKFATCAYSESDKPIVFGNINKSKCVRKLQSKLKHIQRVVARKYEAGNKLHPDKKWQKTNAIKKYERIMARIFHKLANIRKDQRCKIVDQLVNLAPQTIVIEDLNVDAMKRNRQSSKSASEIGFYSFRQALQQKCLAKGIELVIADRYFPSSQICSKCGYRHKGLRRRDYVYKCPHCGYVIDRDYNAAINLMNYCISNK